MSFRAMLGSPWALILSEGSPAHPPKHHQHHNEEAVGGPIHWLGGVGCHPKHAKNTTLGCVAWAQMVFVSLAEPTRKHGGWVGQGTRPLMTWARLWQRGEDKYSLATKWR